MKRLFFENINGRSLLRLLVALFFLLPLFWMIMASLIPQGQALPLSWPWSSSGTTLENFGRLFRLLPIGRYTLNSLIVAGVALPISLIIGSLAGLGMARLSAKSQRRWVVISLSVLMIPGIALWIPRFILYSQLGWYDSIMALIAPAWMGTSPFFVLMFYRAFRRIPSAIYDAAQLDGAGMLRTWWSVTLPMARTTVFAVSLLTFVIYWGDFTSPFLYLRSGNLITLPVALQSLQQMSRSDWPLMLSAAVWTITIPVLLLILLQPLINRLSRSNRKP